MSTYAKLLKRFFPILLFSTLVLGCPNSPTGNGIQAYKAGDYKKALQILKPLAEQGDSKAQYSLGVMYGEGEAVPQDYAEAVKWYRKAAEQEYSYAQNNLGLMYENGRGVPQDNIEAHKWYTLAASRTQGEVHENSVHNRDIAEKKMTPAQIAEAQKLAQEWKPKTRE